MFDASETAIQAYREAFGDSFGVDLIPVGFVAIDEQDRDHYCPGQETESVFLNRIKRSKECGRNLFYEEWPVFEYEPGVIY